MAIAQRLGGGAEASRPGSAVGAAEIIDALEAEGVMGMVGRFPTKQTIASILKQPKEGWCYGGARTSCFFSIIKQNNEFYGIGISFSLPIEC